MLTEQRHELILKLLEENGSIEVTEIKDLLEASESTVRRDITALDKAGKLTKVFGGAVAAKEVVTAHEFTVAQKIEINREEKKRIAKYAAALIGPEDFVYLDAGTTTGYMLDYLEERQAYFVTNAVAHAQRLVTKGMKVILIGGELKASTVAVIVNLALRIMVVYIFKNVFFATTGVTKKSGCTTPDVNEAMIKQTAMEQCKNSYVVCDSSKFDRISSVTFAPFYETVFLTE